MNFETYHKARTFFRRRQVWLVDFSVGHAHFQVGPKKYDVFYSPRGGWSCNAAKPSKEIVGGKETVVAKGCVLFGRGLDCSHVRACKLFLKRLNERYINQEGDLDDCE